MDRFINPFRMAEYARERRIGSLESSFYLFVLGLGLFFWVVIVALWNTIQADPELAIVYDPAWLAYADLAFIATSMPLVLIVGWLANRDGKDFWYRLSSIGFSLTVLSLAIFAFIALLTPISLMASEATPLTLFNFLVAAAIGLIGLVLQYLAMRRAAR